jgi:hypothetical protein
MRWRLAPFVGVLVVLALALDSRICLTSECLRGSLAQNENESSMKDFRVSRTALEGKHGEELIAAVWTLAQAEYERLSRTDKALHQTFSALTSGQRAVTAVAWLDDQVNNGGFDQYFYNTDGDFATEALDGLRRIGSTLHTPIVEAAMACFPGGSPPRDRSERQSALQSLSGDAKALLDALDSRFYQANHQEDLYFLLGAYIRAHPGDFTK